MLFYKTFENKNTTQWMVFIHGLGGSSAVFYKQIAVFAAEYNLLLIDLAGHGQSKARLPFSRQYSYDEIISNVMEVIDYLQLTACHFMGCSMGTIVIRKIAQLYPQRVKSMIMAGTIIEFNLRSKILLTIVRPLRKFMPYMWIYKFYSKILMPKKRHQFSRNMFIDNAIKIGQKEFSRWLALTTKITDYLSHIYSLKISIPTLYIMGEEDYMFLPRVKQFLEKYPSKNAFLSIVPNAGHLCNIDNSLFFNKTAMNFLKNMKEI
ncbi:MAG: alpha/beta hydrolase [Bacteroidales bacterium]|jgi:pimeloyl-ACP methyl ester carboxylesterase|nr:alpha/beta hydrolase [Bacteroidales bacterium]